MKNLKEPEKNIFEKVVHPGQKKKSAFQKKTNLKKDPQTGLDGRVKTRTILLWLFIICTLSFIAFSPTLKNEITNWDDNKYISENPYFKKLDGNDLKKMFSEYYMGNYHPLSMLTLTADFLIAGRDHDGNVKPWMFQTGNILLHLITTVLVFWFVYLIFRKFDIAVVAGLLFGLHALHVESVTWMSERKDVLYAAFFVASLVSYVQYVRLNKIMYFIFSFLLFVLSLFSKGQAVSLVVTLFAIDYIMGRKLLTTKVILEKIPFFILAVIFGMVAINAQRAVQDITDYELYQRIAFAGYGFLQYLLKLILPINLSAIYPYPDIIHRTIPVYYWLSVIPAMGTIAFSLYVLKKSKEIFFGIAFFVINIFILLQFIPVGGAVYADRYAYIPSVGFCILGGLGYHYLVHRPANHKLLINLVLGVYLILLGVLTFQRTQKWESSFVLWNDVLAKQPNAVAAWNNRGSLKYRAKDYTGAIDDFTNAIERNPGYANALYNRGTAKKDLGIDRHDKTMLQEASLDFNRAIEINADFSSAYFNRGFIKDYMGDQAGAIVDFDKAIQLNQKDPNPYISRGVAKGKTGRFREAIEEFSFVIQKFPENSSAYSNRGLARDQMGDTKGAIVDFNKAIDLDPKFVAAITSRGIARRKIKDFNGAIADFSRSIALEPQTIDPYFLRGLTFLDSGNKEAACSDFSKAALAGHGPAKQMYQQNCTTK